MVPANAGTLHGNDNGPERWSSALAQNCSDAVVAVDAQGCVRYANTAAARLLGGVPAHTGSLFGAVHPEDRARVASLLAGPGDTGAPVAVRIKDPSGGWRVLETSATDHRTDPAVGALILTGRDVTETCEARDALARSESLLREAQNMAHIGHWQGDLPYDRFDWVADEIFAIHGIDADQWGGTVAAYLDFVPLEDHPLIRDAMARCIETGSASVVHRIVRPDGAVRFVRHLCRMVTDAPGTAQRMVGTCQDVTEQELTRRSLQRRVQELTCLVEVGRAAHEIDDLSALCEATAAAVVSSACPEEPMGVRVQLDATVRTRGELRGAPVLRRAPVLVGDRPVGEVAVACEGRDPEDAQRTQFVQAVAGVLALWCERRSSSTALARSEARFRRLFDNALDVVYRYRIDRDAGFDYISPSVKRVTGYAAEEYLADPALAYEIVHPDDASRLAAAFTGALDRQEGALIRIISRDGSTRWTEHRTVPIFGDDGMLVAAEGVARDVTSGVEATLALEQRAREQEAIARLGATALSTDSLAVVFDAAAAAVADTLGVDAAAVFELVSDDYEVRAAAGAGCPAELVGVRVAPESAEDAGFASDTPCSGWGKHRNFATSVLASHGLTGGVTEVVGGLRGPVGAVGAYTTGPRAFAAEESAFLQSVANVLGGAVERHRAADAIRRSEREFRGLAEHSPDVIGRFDRELRHLYVNPRVVSVTGIPAEAHLGKTNSELGHPPAIVALWEEAQRYVFASGEPASVAFQYPTENGTASFTTRIIPEFGADGDVETVLAVSRDITELRRAEQERRDILTRVVAAQEEERARIGEDIHDDSIQVMAAVGMRLEALKMQLADPGALAMVGRLDETVQLAISRLRALMFALRPAELDHDGLAATLRLYLETLPQDGLPLWDLVDDCSEELALETRAVLYRIALEAIVNARKHAGASFLHVRLDDCDDGVRLQVRDDGSGFDPSGLAALGRHHIGTQTMRERAETAGGRLDIRSSPGQGTVVTAWLPLRDPSMAS